MYSDTDRARDDLTHKATARLEMHAWTASRTLERIEASLKRIEIHAAQTSAILTGPASGISFSALTLDAIADAVADEYAARLSVDADRPGL